MLIIRTKYPCVCNNLYSYIHVQCYSCIQSNKLTIKNIIVNKLPAFSKPAIIYLQLIVMYL